MKQKNKAVMMMILAIIGMGLSCCFFHFVTNNQIFGVQTITLNQYQQIIQDKKEKDFDISLLTYEHESIPYDQQSNTLYLSIGSSGDYKGKLIVSHGHYALAIVIPNQSMNELMEQAIPLQLIIYGNDWYFVTNIQLSSLPIVTIDTNTLIKIDSQEGKDVYSASMHLYNSNGQRKLYEVDDYDVHYHMRGNATRYNNKLSYKVEIKNKNGDKENVALLGMRKDDDWILNGMSYDASYLREAISREIWNEINPDVALHMQYVELIIDNQYLGLYALQEPLDKKQWNASEEDILIKVNDWLFDEYVSDDPNGYNNLILNDEDDKCIIDEFEFKNCSSQNYVDRLYIRNLLRYIESSETDKYLEYDWNDCINVQVFYNMVMAIDSTYKNARLLAKPMDYGYMIHRAVWDFDYNFVSDMGSDGIYQDAFIPPMYLNDPQFQKNCQQLYQRVATTIYNEKAMNQLIDNYQHVLVSSGAWQRDYNQWENQLIRWDSMNGLAAIQQLKETIINRITWLNNYYQFKGA